MTSAWVEVRNCNWVHEAQFFRSVLESAGIDALIPDEHTLSVQPMYGAALGGVRLLVHAEDLQQAAELLANASAAADNEPADDSDA
jgi:Putative prokaryotic signal transducing protein